MLRFQDWIAYKLVESPSHSEDVVYARIEGVEDLDLIVRREDSFGEACISRRVHLTNHFFLDARLKYPRRLFGHDGMAEIRALTLSAPVALKEVELRSGFHSYCNDSLLQTLSDTDHSADKG
jgi:hypothetical protein